jgi:hypothetical protein
MKAARAAQKRRRRPHDGGDGSAMASSEYLIHLPIKVRAGLVSQGGWSLFMAARRLDSGVTAAGPLDGGVAARWRWDRLMAAWPLDGGGAAAGPLDGGAAAAGPLDVETRQLIRNSNELRDVLS